MDKNKQGIAALRAPMAKDVERLSQYSRGDDRNLAHVAPGDTIIPPELLRANPAFADMVMQILADAGIDPAKRVVDSGAARRNPVTGAQEFDWDGDGMYSYTFDIPAGGTAADFLEGGGGYSFEDFYNDMLARDYYDNVVRAGRTGGDPFGGYGTYTGATGGTGVQTDETRYGEPMGRPTAPAPRPDYTPDRPTPDAPIDIGFDPADLLYAGDSELGDLLSGYQPPEAPVAAPPTPVTPPPTPVTPPPSTAPTGREGDVDPVLGIPPEILDMIDVGVELPIPGPGTELLPVILGSVGDIIEGIQYPVDPTTGQIPSSAGGQAAQAVENAVNSVMNSVRGAIRGATTGQVQEYVRNAVLAGQTVGEIINSVQEVFAAPEPTPIPGPSTPAIPPTSAAPPATTGGRAGLEPDFALPGSREEEERAAAEQAAAEQAAAEQAAAEQAAAEQAAAEQAAAEQAAAEQAAAERAAAEQAAAEEAARQEAERAAAEEAARRAEEQAAAEEAARRAEEQAAAEAARRAEEQAAAEAARQAAEEQAAAEAAARQEAERAAAEAARRAEQEAAAAAERAAQQEAANAAVTGALDSVRDQVEAYRQEGLTGNQAVREAVDAVAEDLDMTREELLGALGATEDSILAEMEAQGAELRSEIISSRNAVLDQVRANEAAGMARDEALNDALDSVAADLGTTREELLGELGTTREELGGQIETLRAEGAAGRQAILDQMQENEAAGMARDEALNEALQQVADDMGVAVEDLMSELGTTREELSGDIADLGARLAETETNILDQVAANEAAGMARDEALGVALDQVADDLGVTRETLLNEIGRTEDDLRDYIGTTEQRLGTQISDLGRQIGARDLIGMLSQPGVLSQRVDVDEAELADIGDLYDFESIFRTAEQEGRFATPYAEGGEVEAGYSAMKSAHPRIRAEALALAEELGLDPEMLAASMMMGDLEFQADVAPFFGPFGQEEGIDPRRARLIPSQRKYTTAGFYVLPDATDEGLEKIDREYSMIPAQLAKDLGRELTDRERVFAEPDMVYAIGGGASPNTWAHEFRHRHLGQGGGLGSEKNVRYLDALYETSPYAQYLNEAYNEQRRGRSPLRDLEQVAGGAFFPNRYQHIAEALAEAGLIDPTEMYPREMTFMEELLLDADDPQMLAKQLLASQNIQRGVGSLRKLRTAQKRMKEDNK